MILTDETGKQWEVDEKHLQGLKKKAVDLAYLVDSGIDCQFSDRHLEGSGTIDKLHSFTIGEDGECRAASHEVDHTWLYCRPRMNYWHHWDSKKPPLPEGFKVKLKFYRRGHAHPWSAYSEDLQDMDWAMLCAFKVIGLSEGYCYPWEVET